MNESERKRERLWERYMGAIVKKRRQPLSPREMYSTLRVHSPSITYTQSSGEYYTRRRGDDQDLHHPHATQPEGTPGRHANGMWRTYSNHPRMEKVH